MNRIIKFRAYDKKEKKMYNEPRLSFGASLDGPYVEFLRNNHWVDCLFSSDTVSIMQFTGLKDKNGKEIYEGDIVRSPWKTFYIIKFIDGSFIAEGINEYDKDYFMGVVKDKFEVIGNIYENPDLIK